LALRPGRPFSLSQCACNGGAQACCVEFSDCGQARHITEAASFSGNHRKTLSEAAQESARLMLDDGG
jgi:hypothetical protein